MPKTETEQHKLSVSVSVISITFDPELSCGFCIRCREVDTSCHVHAAVEENQNVSRSFLLYLHILREKSHNKQNKQTENKLKSSKKESLLLKFNKRWQGSVFMQNNAGFHANSFIKLFPKFGWLGNSVHVNVQCSTRDVTYKQYMIHETIFYNTIIQLCVHIRIILVFINVFSLTGADIDNKCFITQYYLGVIC